MSRCPCNLIGLVYDSVFWCFQVTLATVIMATRYNVLCCKLMEVNLKPGLLISFFVSKLCQVAASLNSNGCFLLQSGSSVFSWHGNQSTYEQQQLAAKLAEFLKVRTSLEFFNVFSFFIVLFNLEGPNLLYSVAQGDYLL